MARIGDGDHLGAGRLQLPLLIGSVLESAVAGDGLRNAARQPRCLQVVPERLENGLRRPELLNQPVRFARSQAGDRAQGEPVKGIGGSQYKEWVVSGKALMGKSKRCEACSDVGKRGIPWPIYC